MREMESDLRQELSQARAEFQKTSNEIRRRLQTEEPSLERELKRNPAASILASAGLGFMIGHAARHTAVFLSLLTGAGIGYLVVRSESQRNGRRE